VGRDKPHKARVKFDHLISASPEGAGLAARPLFSVRGALPPAFTISPAERRKATPAIAYLRTSSASADKDSDKAQRAAAFAKRAGFEILEEFSRCGRRRR
jgi:hypothetical protein